MLTHQQLIDPTNISILLTHHQLIDPLPSPQHTHTHHITQLMSYVRGSNNRFENKTPDVGIPLLQTKFELNMWFSLHTYNRIEYSGPWCFPIHTNFSPPTVIIGCKRCTGGTNWLPTSPSNSTHRTKHKSRRQTDLHNVQGCAEWR